MYRNLLPFLLVLIVSCSKDPALFQVNFDVNPKDGGSINLSSDTYFEGETLNIEANASKNYVFDNWSGDFYGTDSAAVININSDKKIDDLIVTLREIADNSVDSEEDPTIGPSKELEALTILIGGQEKLLERLLIESDNSEMRMNLRNIDTNLLRALEELPLNYREATDGLKNDLGKIVEAIELIDRSKSDTEASGQSRKD